MPQQNARSRAVVTRPRDGSHLRTVWAARLRSLADRLAPHPLVADQPLVPAHGRRFPAPLVRVGGAWWYRNELIPLETAEDLPQNVHLRP